MKMMSATEMPTMPAPDVVHADGRSFGRYRNAFTTLQVFDLGDNGRRLEINDDGHRVSFDLDAGQAAHPAGLLCAGSGE